MLLASPRRVPIGHSAKEYICAFRARDHSRCVITHDRVLSSRRHQDDNDRMNLYTFNMFCVTVVQTRLPLVGLRNRAQLTGSCETALFLRLTFLLLLHLLIESCILSSVSPVCFFYDVGVFSRQVSAVQTAWGFGFHF